MKIFGLIKVRNEEKIIKDTLNHWGSFCTGGIYVVDDVSTDKTREICKTHPAVNDVLETKDWDVDRERAEHVLRQRVLSRAQKDAGPDDWFIYFDADERLYFDDWQLLFERGVGAIACRLYDVYITPEDIEKQYFERNFVGPEFRTIVFLFKKGRPRPDFPY